MVKLNNRKTQDHDSRKGFDAPRAGKRSAAISSAPPEQPVDSKTKTDENLPSPAGSPASSAVLQAWEDIRNLWRYAVEAVVRQVVTLFRRKNGAPPPGPWVAVFMILVLFVYVVCRRPHEPTPPSPRETRTPRRSSTLPQDLLARDDLDRGLRSSPVAVAATSGLSSPSRSLFPEPQQAPGSPMRGADSPPLDDIDPSLPSPAQARAAQARTEQTRAPRMQRLTRQGRTERETEGGRETRWRWRGSREAGWWWRLRGWTRSGELRSAGGGRHRRRRRPWYRRCLPWLVLLWLCASVLEVTFEVYRLWLRLSSVSLPSRLQAVSIQLD